MVLMVEENELPHTKRQMDHAKQAHTLLEILGCPTFADLKAKELYLKKLLKYVKKEQKKGTTLDQLKEKTTTIPGAEDWQGGRLKNVNLQVAWDELSKDQ